MKAVLARQPGGPEVLALGELPDPEPGPGEVLVEVAATAVNRADLLQRRGLYAPPPGASDVLGLECSGTVAALGEGVDGWSVGDRVCALLSGGGYAEQVVVPAGQLMPLPPGVELTTAAALPEAACTVWSNVFMLARLQAGEHVLVHGGAGGIGTMAIQVAHALGARVYTTGGSAAKLELCRELGADVTISYRDQDFVDVVRRESEGHGADVILDNMGAKYLARNVEALAFEGRLAIIGMQGGTTAEIDLGRLFGKNGTVSAALLRVRPVEQKAAVCAGVVEHVWPLIGEGRVRPMVHRTLPLADAAEAHAHMESGDHTGKILLTT